MVGEGPQTSAVSIISATVPVTPAAPTKHSASSTSITIDWVIPNDGGSPITGFTLEMNAGTGSTSFSQVASITDPTSTSYTKSSGLTTGQEYSFKLLATNLVGPSVASPQSDAIAAAVVPD